MAIRIYAKREVYAVEVKHGDYLIDPRLPHGFGYVELVGAHGGNVALLVGKRAMDFPASATVEIADVIGERYGYATRAVEGDEVGFVYPKPLFES